MQHGGLLETVGSKVLRTEQQIRCRRAIETETALASFIQCNEGQRSLGLIGAHDAIGGNAGLLQALQQKIAEHVAPQHADKMCRTAQPRHCNGDVGRRTTGVLRKRARLIRTGRRQRQHVDQGLAKTDHPILDSTHARASASAPRRREPQMP